VSAFSWLLAAAIGATSVVAPAPDHNTAVSHRALVRCTKHRHHHCASHRPAKPRRQIAPRPVAPRPPGALPVPQPAPALGATPAPTVAPTITPAPLPRRTSVRLDDTDDPWVLAPERDRLGAGQITFTAYNRGMDDHNLSVDSASRAVHYGGVDLPANQTDDPPTLTVDLAPGRYVLFCDLPGHEQAGMVASITVE
jgi:plastocyanin